MDGQDSKQDKKEEKGKEKKKKRSAKEHGRPMHIWDVSCCLHPSVATAMSCLE